MRKQLAIVGLSAGLVAGGAAGFAFTSGTGFAGAQATTTTAPATSDAPGADADRPDPGARLAEVLAPLVADGTLTQAQADKVVETLEAAGPMGGGHGGPGRFGHRREGLDAAATALGMTADELRTELRNGSTLAEVAEAKGVDVQKVIDAMVAEVKEELDEAVAAGRITQEKADERLADITERIGDRVNESGPPAGGPRGDGPPPEDAPADDSTTTTEG